MSFFPALASNMLNMVGVGPFLTVPLILGTMRGPQSLLGWICGTLISLCDGLVWSELGAAMPASGGSYEYLRRAFGPKSAGNLMSFLFVWQVVLVGPLTAASGGVGFADYARYWMPQMTDVQHTVLAMSVCIAVTFLLYRDIRAIGRISQVLWVGLVVAIGIIIFSGAIHFSPQRAFSFPSEAFHLSSGFFLGLGAATLISTYDFSGYFNICLIGGEVETPAITIPRTIVLSIATLSGVYIAISLAIIGVVPWREAITSMAIISDFTARLYGPSAAAAMTGLILWIAFASVFCVLLGYTRVPFAAAVQGQFFSPFARLHARRGFPSFSVIAMGILSAVACLLSLDALIRTLIVVQIITQLAPQCLAVMVMRQRRLDVPKPFQMPLYPLPALAALAGWIFVLCCSGRAYLVAGVIVTIAGVLAYLLRAKRRREWPFGI